MSATSSQNSLTENPYAAPTARLADALRPDELALAERGTRLGAALLDGIVLAGPIAVAGIVAAITLPAYQRSVGAGGGGTATWAAFGLLGLLVFIGFIVVIAINCVWLDRYGQTIAKRWLGIKVVRSDGSPCPLSRIILLRWLPMFVMNLILRFIPIIGPLVSFVDPLLIFRNDRRCLHDLIADTKVVKA
jgi:uncharacterized RDD family membrane protein YckC